MSWTRRLPSGKWQGGARGPDGRRHTAAFPTRQAARAWAAETELELRSRRGRRTAVTVGEWAPSWWPQWTVETSTRATARGRLDRYLLPEWSDVEMGDITTFRVQRWAHRMLADGTGRETVRAAVRLLSALCSGAVQADLLAANPCLQVRLPSPVKRTPRFLTAAELDKVVGILEPQYGAMATVAAFTGLRWGELAGLHAHRVDLPNRRLHVVETLLEVNGHVSVKPYPKSATSARTVPLASRAVDALEPYLSGTGLVFVGSRGAPLSRGNVRSRVWQPALKVAALEDPQPRWHDLRHTCASWLVQDGVPIYEVQRMLGHSSVAVTEIYAHLAVDSYERVLAALER